MSGGRWQYLQHLLENNAEIYAEALKLLASIEHILDWGTSGDTCYACAKIQTIEMLEAWFDSMSGNWSTENGTWQDIKDNYESRCDKCKEQDAARGT